MNTIKYTAGTETLSLKKDNFYFGVGDSDKGPTEISGYYAGITPATSGYTIYLARTGTSEPSIYSVSNDNDLINLTNIIAATAFTNTEQCLTYYRNQTDKVCVNIDYEPIVTDGLVLNFDAGFTPSYPRTGTTWYDVSLSGTNSTLTNGPTFNSLSGGSIAFDGTNDYVISNVENDFNKTANISVTVVVKYNNFNASNLGRAIFKSSNLNENTGITLYQYPVSPYNKLSAYVITPTGLSGLSSASFLETNRWYMMTVTYDSSDLKIYIDGVLDNSVSAPGGISWPLTPRKPIMGTSYGSYFSGNISLVLVHNKALLASEVFQNYTAVKDRFIPPSPSPTPTSTPIPTPTPSPTGGIVTDSLFMKLDASNYTSGLWEDETGNGNDATINGATWSSTDGGIFDLDGSNDNISIPHTSNLSLNTTTQRTIQVWVKFDALGSTSTQQIPVFGKLSSNFSFDGYWGGLYGNTGTIRVVTNGGSTQRITTSTLTVTTNTWYLFTFISQITSTPNTTKVYINETEYATTAHGSDSYSESNPLYLGYIGSGVSSPYLNGKIGACYFYTKGLSTSDISDNFNATKSKYGL
jgi:hypothetical protein